MLAQKIHVKNRIFVFPDFSYNNQFMYPIKTYMKERYVNYLSNRIWYTFSIQESKYYVKDKREYPKLAAAGAVYP